MDHGPKGACSQVSLNNRLDRWLAKAKTLGNRQIEYSFDKNASINGGEQNNCLLLTEKQIATKVKSCVCAVSPKSYKSM